MGKLDAKTRGNKVEVAQRSPTQTSEERRYRAEDNLRTIQSYHRIAGDASAMKDVQALAREQMATLAKVAGHAHGATTRGRDTPRAAGTSGQTKASGPPKSAKQGGSSGGGARKMGAASKTSSKGA